MAKLNFQQPLLQSSIYHDPSEILWYANLVLETLISNYQCFQIISCNQRWVEYLKLYKIKSTYINIYSRKSNSLNRYLCKRVKKYRIKKTTYVVSYFGSYTVSIIYFYLDIDTIYVVCVTANENSDLHH